MTFPLATLAATVTSAGITSPSFADILQSLQTSLQLIYGQDVYFGPDTQDGQMLAIFAQAIFDSNQTAIAVYNQFSPATAQGAGLSSIVKINGIARLIPSNSQVDVLIGGTVGTAINNGIVADVNGQTWALPPSITIPSGGAILVTATAVNPGAIQANPGQVSIINTPTLGWATVTNPSSASTGEPVETDASLRVRQAQSVALPAITVRDATAAAIEALTGVVEAKVYENDTGDVDANGLPPHSISAVVSGGDATEIATAIQQKKTPGCATYGTTSVPVTDIYGITSLINFFVPTNVSVSAQVTIKSFQGYTSAIGDAIKQAIVDYINNTLTIGDDVFIKRVYLPAQLYGNIAAGSSTYELTALLLSNGGPFVDADVVIPFNAQAVSSIGLITLTVT